MFGLNLKPKPSTTTDSSTGMGMLLVLFPQDKSTTTSTTTTNKLTSLSSSKSLLSKTQSTISICALLLFTTLLLFTISTIPTTTPPSSSSSTPRRRTSLLQKPTFALQKMGTLYRRGTRAMPDLLICHVPDDTPTDDFRLFLRLLHRSSLTASTDVVFIFTSPSSTSTFSPIVLQENQAFLSLLHSYSHLNRTHALNSTFRPTRFLHQGKQVGSGEPLWGPKNRSNSSNNFTKLSYGSVLSFDATELDPENSLSGFLDRVPLSLRRWACYPMLLGRVRRNFKHVMLVDAKNILVQSDPMGRVRNRSPESVFMFTKHHGRKRQSGVSPAVVMGGARGVRRLASAVVVEIVRAATQQHKKRKNPVTDSSVLSQLASNEFTLRNKSVRLIDSAESIPEFGSHNSGATSSFSDYAIIQRGSGNHDVNSVIKKQMCSSVVDSSVYRDC